MDLKTFRDNLFQMNTRRFGKVMEVAVSRLTSSEFSHNVYHDLDTNKGTRIEVKFSRVEKQHPQAITENNVLDVIQREGLYVRMFQFEEWHYQKFNCNIQQLKRDEFDILIYGLLFADRVLVFMATPEAIGENMKYSDRQHKGNKGEGQFHITPSTLQYHIDNHLLATLSYYDLLKLLS